LFVCSFFFCFFFVFFGILLVQPHILFPGGLFFFFFFFLLVLFPHGVPTVAAPVDLNSENMNWTNSSGLDGVLGEPTALPWTDSGPSPARAWSSVGEARLPLWVRTKDFKAVALAVVEDSWRKLHVLCATASDGAPITIARGDVTAVGAAAPAAAVLFAPLCAAWVLSGTRYRSLLTHEKLQVIYGEPPKHVNVLFGYLYYYYYNLYYYFSIFRLLIHSFPPFLQFFFS